MEIRFTEDRRLPSDELIPAGTIRADFSDEDAAAFVNNGVAEYANGKAPAVAQPEEVTE